MHGESSIAFQGQPDRMILDMIGPSALRRMGRFSRPMRVVQSIAQGGQDAN